MNSQEVAPIYQVWTSLLGIVGFVAQDREDMDDQNLCVVPSLTLELVFLRLLCFEARTGMVCDFDDADTASEIDCI
ncbi:hypothetical protein WICPIJ_006553 [Wickerhamomyces pijperi]|uniref:Uncharacterized protein n=1 Tax=Wickerhamomyces pijperi TaxID=599730 RepID=A0A9P8TKW5_WICPI|nr:hypothetical protein WICPIJ_006553 [Wickerhamomyces pijperi]